MPCSLKCGNFQSFGGLSVSVFGAEERSNKVLTAVAGYILNDNVRNSDIRTQLKVNNLNEMVEEQERNERTRGAHGG
jgi:hypothetical protein